jgi:hypothetical protein
MPSREEKAYAKFSSVLYDQNKELENFVKENFGLELK